MENNIKFFSEELREEIEEHLEDRIYDAASGDRDVIRGMIRHGQEGIEEMSDERLMEEYELWNGHYDEYEDVNDIDDPVYKKMVIARRDYEADQIILGGSNEENDDDVVGDQCADSYVGLHNHTD